MEILKIENLNKNYGNQRVLKDICMKFEKGEIHGLIGANGSGKSTLMSILFGNNIIQQTGGYKGDIFFEGKKVKIKTAKEAVNLGIGMIYQEFMLISDMTVAENITLSEEKTSVFFNRIFSRRFSRIDRKKNSESARRNLESLGFSIDVDTKVEHLSVNAKQFVEIARELEKKNLKLLILDEPTAVLNKDDSFVLLDTLKKISEKGTTIIFISHRLEEVCAICDNVTVLKDGVIVSRYSKEDFDAKQIAYDMVGYDIIKTSSNKRNLSKEAILSYKNFYVRMQGEEIKNIALDIYKGEILGIYSLSGHGKLALAYGTIGYCTSEGEMAFKGENFQNKNIYERIKEGLYILADDRGKFGLLKEHSIADNISFSAFHVMGMYEKERFSFLSFKNKKAVKKLSENDVKRFDIKCTSINQKVRTLSGGNQQKVCIARAVAVKPEVLFISEPTRGVDIAAKERILNILQDINEIENTTIIMASSEIEELRRICSRIIIMFEGRISDILSPDDSLEKFSLAISDVKYEK